MFVSTMSFKFTKPVLGEKNIFLLTILTKIIILTIKYKSFSQISNSLK